MQLRKIYFTLFCFALCIYSCKEQSTKKDYDTTRILAYEVNPKIEQLQFFWKNSQGDIYGNAKNLKEQLEANKQELVFAMNGGMYLKDQSPQGLYIENGIEHAPLDTKTTGYGNFYLQPNGIFYLTKDNRVAVSKTTTFRNTNTIKYATQSGPMLVIDGKLHPKFTEGSQNVHIRNGVGVLPNGNLLFAMSKQKINFYDFATFFKENGCQNALYLDGFVSRTYLPEKNYEQVDGNFGVIIGVTKASKN
jgi:uncharacterized protein YigE (DUF2233 family)